MKEKMLSTAASRGGKSPTKSASIMNIARPVSKNGKDAMKGNDERSEKTNV